MRNPAWTKVEDWMGDKDEPLSGFSWAYGSHRHTTGIIIWSDVFLYDAPSGDKIAILLMDTQGLFDHKSSPTENARIFSFSTLISSVQIFNLFNHIHEDELQYLQFATDLAKFVTEGTPFQNLMFLIRDWQYAEEHAYGLDGGQGLLDEVLKIEEDQQEELKSLRQYIYKSFEKISCFLMPHPGDIVTSKKNYDGRWSQIKPKFVEQLKNLVKIILSPNELKLKEINGVPITAQEFMSTIEEYVKIYKSDIIPKAQSIYEANVTNHMKKLVATCVSTFNDALNNNLILVENYEDIYNIHFQIQRTAMRNYAGGRKVGTEDHKIKYEEILKEELKESYDMWYDRARYQVEKIEESNRMKEEKRKEKQRLAAKRLERLRQEEEFTRRQRELSLERDRLRQEKILAQELYEEKLANLERERLADLENERLADLERERLADLRRERLQREERVLAQRRNSPPFFENFINFINYLFS